jgi:hypothetical protein
LSFVSGDILFPECDVFSLVWSSTITPSTKGSMLFFFFILNASSKEDFEFLLESVNQWDTLCTYHYLNKAKTTIISTSNIFIMVGYNCFIIFQYYYLNIEILKFYENWNFLNFWKILSFWNFLKILKSYENFEFFLHF